MTLMDKMTPALLLSAQSVIAKDIEIKWYVIHTYTLSFIYLLEISSKKEQTCVILSSYNTRLQRITNSLRYELDKLFRILQFPVQSRFEFEKIVQEAT